MKKTSLRVWTEKLRQKKEIKWIRRRYDNVEDSILSHASIRDITDRSWQLLLSIIESQTFLVARMQSTNILNSPKPKAKRPRRIFIPKSWKMMNYDYVTLADAEQQLYSALIQCSW